ncbi:terpene synthase family protein [Streptomyces klenkii]
MAKLIDGQVSFHLPEIKRILPTKRHPAYATVEAENQQFIPSLRRPYYRNGEELARNLEDLHALWGCLVNPSSTTPRSIQYAHWISNWFAVDDLLSDAEKAGCFPEVAEAVIREITPVLQYRDFEHGEGEHRRAAKSTLYPIYADMTEGIRGRFIGEMLEFVTLYQQEVEMRMRGEIPDFPEYMAIHTASGCWCNTTLAEYGLGMDLTEELQQYPKLRQACRIVHESFVFANDLFSFRKEYFQGDYGNAISVFMVNEGLSLQESVDKLCSLIEEAESRFTVLRRQILSGPLGSRSDIRSYLDELGYCMSGNLEWSYLTPRYHGAGFVWNGQRLGTVVLTPERTCFCDGL